MSPFKIRQIGAYEVQHLIVERTSFGGGSYEEFFLEFLIDADFKGNFVLHNDSSLRIFLIIVYIISISLDGGIVSL